MLWLWESFFGLDTLQWNILIAYILSTFNFIMPHKTLLDKKFMDFLCKGFFAFKGSGAHSETLLIGVFYFIFCTDVNAKNSCITRMNNSN